MWSWRGWRELMMEGLIFAMNGEEWWAKIEEILFDRIMFIVDFKFGWIW